MFVFPITVLHPCYLHISIKIVNTVGALKLHIVLIFEACELCRYVSIIVHSIEVSSHSRLIFLVLEVPKLIPRGDQDGNHFTNLLLILISNLQVLSSESFF